MGSAELLAARWEMETRGYTGLTCRPTLCCHDERTCNGSCNLDGARWSSAQVRTSGGGEGAEQRGATREDARQRNKETSLRIGSMARLSVVESLTNLASTAHHTYALTSSQISILWCIFFLSFCLATFCPATEMQEKLPQCCSRGKVKLER